MSTDHIQFNRVTYALPVQPFKVTAFISTEERLPAVTEFVLRLLHTCGRVSLLAFRDYFGFSEAEALSVIESLDRQGYVSLSDDSLTLGEEMRQRFEASPDDCPWVTKLKRRSDVVPFDLLTFSMLGRAEFAFATDNWVKLNPLPDIVGSSVERARRAYRESFGRIERESARSRGEERERSYGVHSIESVEPRKAGFIPLTVSLEIDSRNVFSARLPSEFEAGASLELLTEFRERMALSFESQTRGGDGGLQEFLELFQLDFLQPYVAGNTLSAHRLAADIERGLPAPTGVQPIFGNLCLKKNRDTVLSLVHEARTAHKGFGKHLGSVAWMAPDYEFWGRGEDFRLMIDALRKTVRNGPMGDDLFVFDRAQERQEAAVRGKFAGTGLVELHLVRPDAAAQTAWRSSVELMLYPGRFAGAVLHVPLEATPGVRVGVGFVSTQSKHLRIVHQMVLDAANGNRYAGRWSPNRDAAASRSMTLFEQCQFLAYSDIHQADPPSKGAKDQPS